MKPILIEQEAISLSSGGLYPYSDELVKFCSRVSRFGDPYSLCRVITSPTGKKLIKVPRRMVASAKTCTLDEGLNVKYKSSFAPRNSEQSRIINEATSFLLAGNSFLLEAPTASGKTVMALEIIARLGKRAIVVVTKTDIKNQWIEAIKKILGLTVGKGIGIIQGDVCQTEGQSIVIAMIQSIAKEGRYPSYAYRGYGVVVYDEVHLVAADFFSQSCFQLPAKLRLGLSATVSRIDGKEDVIYAHIGPVMVKAVGTPLTPLVVAVKSPWKVPLTRRMNKATGENELIPIPHSPGKCAHVTKLLARHHERNKMISEFVSQAYKAGRITLVQSDFKEHLDTLFNLFQARGIPQADIGFYLGGMSKDQLNISKGKKLILGTFQMTSTATDIPWLDTLVMATPKSDMRQIVGRVLREYPDKKQPLVWDIVDWSSNVFSGYWSKRGSLYRKMGAEVKLTWITN